MTLDDICPATFRRLHRELGHRPLVCVSTDSDFCRDVVSQGLFTPEQVALAAERYRLDKSRSGKCIFWLIDERGNVRDGHIGQSWVSQMLRQRHPDLSRYIVPSHCLFGLHLMESQKAIAIVDTEPSAVILSVLYPALTWMAYSLCLTIDLLEPLRGHRVILYPRTDSLEEHYLAALELADQARRLWAIDIRVSTILEDRATPEQKARQVDLVDFLLGE